MIPEASRGLAAFRIGSQSILFGAEGYFCDSLECVRFIRGPVRKKAVFKAKWNGLRAITKWWSDESHASYATEVAIYGMLHVKRAQDSKAFPSTLAFGEIIYSSIFLHGNILVLSYVHEY